MRGPGTSPCSHLSTDPTVEEDPHIARVAQIGNDDGYTSFHSVICYDLLFFTGRLSVSSLFPSHVFYITFARKQCKPKEASEK